MDIKTRVKYYYYSLKLKQWEIKDRLRKPVRINQEQLDLLTRSSVTEKK